MDIIDFYSYKGGAGRSVTTYNTLPFIVEAYGATPEKPVLVVDMDIDSAGITLLLKKQEQFKESGRIDVADYFSRPDSLPQIQYKPEKYQEHALLKNAVDISELLGIQAKGTVLFLGVNQDAVNKDYKAQKNLDDRLLHLQRACSHYNFSALVIDSASGNQLIAELVLRKADKIVVCLKATTQFRYGTFQYIKNMYAKEAFKSSVKLIVLPLAIPQNKAMLNPTTTYEKDALDRLNMELVEAERRNVKLEKRFVQAGNFGIPEVESFKWEESCLHYQKVFNNKTLLPDEEKAYTQYQALAKCLHEN